MVRVCPGLTDLKRRRKRQQGAPWRGGRLKMKKDGWSLKGTQSSPEKAECSGIEGRTKTHKSKGEIQNLYDRRESEQG